MGSNAVRTAMALVGTVVVAIGVGGCGAEPDVPVAPDPLVDLAQLDVGGNATKPHDYGTAKTLEQAKIVEAERLANFIPLASDIDPRFAHGYKLTSKVFFDPKYSDLGNAIKLEKFTETAPDFITGFASSGTTDPNVQGMDLMNVVMVFPDEQKAKDAVVALERSDFEYSNRNQAVAIPKYPAAKAHWQPHEQSIGSWFAAGKLVVYSWVYDYLRIAAGEVDLTTLVSLVEKSLDVVVPSIAKFTPTPPDQLMNLPVDIDGMLGRTLPRINEELFTNPPGVYTGLAGLHFSTTPITARPALEAAGVDRYARDHAIVYRTRDVAAARKLLAHQAELDKKLRSVESPKNLPQAKCQEYIGSDKFAIRFYCSVSYDRYVALVWSDQLVDLQQRMSAQYALLVNAE
ncbi:hypothetical protein [Nocardia sp. NBC_01009]|uniref:DUF7373 family lipoprotein n=1 Tax=Nocardia sp. NBC_01009 TaxID=2975996 RepID=UPI00386CA1E1|nr:hypothetical protein OHA42_33955 [Nocardia sp. NBC_01009]